MRTEPSTPMAKALARLRTPMGRARRWLATQGLPTRVALLVAGLGALGAVGYLASVDSTSSRSWAWVYEGRRLSADDVSAISEALEAEGIVYLADPSGGRVGVSPDRKVEAMAKLAKRKVLSPTLEELSREAEVTTSFWDDPETRARRDNLRQEQILKTLIEQLDPLILSAHVQIHRVKTRGGLGASTTVSSFIHLQTEGGRRLSSRVVNGIETFLQGRIPDLKPEAITVTDQTGYKYLAAGNPALKDQNEAHAQEEQWRDAIAEGLQHIPGVGVSVLLETVSVPAPKPEPPPVAVAETVRPNGRVQVDPEPAPPAPAPPIPKTRANVWVRIPRTFYYMAFLAQSPGRRPTQDDLKPMQATTEKTVRDAVQITIPREILGEVTIDPVQDDLANARTFLLPPAPEPVRPWPWLALSVVVGVSTGLVVVAALIRLAARRPVARISRSALRPGYLADGPAGPVPGPSERVRELIRLNPEAAAGVLQRWIGQGGALE
ncbi:hypothetical protein P12x_000144 [Tundrisphaera lichenicola]|uniref:hypothetical protein n=1 Tax=Tundrisphaera lichenicola TaxID=2029860 RepID=UPI003EC0EBAE